MKYINNRNKEPRELAEYRETPDATYDGFAEKKIVRQSLSDEQGYICAYCMGRIETDTCTIEHYIPQKRHQDSPYSEEVHKQQSLLYSNMCAVCDNKAEHCDKKRGNIPLEILNPHNPSCEELITYSLDGSILPAGPEKEKVQNDINTLGLDCKKLRELRYGTWSDDIWKRFNQEHEKKDWSKELFLKYAEEYRNKRKTRKGLRFHAYCNFIAWYFEYYADNYKKM